MFVSELYICFCIIYHSQLLSSLHIENIMHTNWMCIYVCVCVQYVNIHVVSARVNSK